MRVAVVGATGALGGELLAVLDESSLPITELVPIATDRSLGTDVEMRGASLPVETSLDALRGAQLAFLCAPPAASLEATRLCLHARIPVIDGSGALALAPEVPLAMSHDASEPGLRDAAAIAIAPGASLAAARALAPIARAFGAARVTATLLESVSGAGRAGVHALSEETIALLSQHDAPDPPALGHPVAFDVLPWIGELDPSGECDGERRFAGVVGRALGGVPVAVTAVRMPVFCGEGIALAIETTSIPSAGGALEALAKEPGIELGAIAPTTRAAAGSADVHVGRVRVDPTREFGLLLWVVADGLRLSAAQAVRVAEARFGRV